MDSLISDLKDRLFNDSRFEEGLDLLRNGQTITFDGVIGSSPSLFGAAAVEKLNRFLLVVTAKVGDVDQVADDLSLFTDVPIDTFPILPPILEAEETEIFNSDELAFGSRLRSLREIALRPSHSPRILVASLSALLQPVPAPDEMNSDARLLKSGTEIDRDQLIRWLLDGGFLSTSAVTLPGEYSVRGSLLDIFPIDRREPIRLEFFGDEIESIRAFDPASQRSVENMTETTLSRLRFKPEMNGSFLDHLPKDTLIQFLETDRIVEETRNFISIDTSKQYGNVHSSVPVADIMNRLYQYPSMHFVSFSSGNEYTDRVIHFPMKSVERFCGNAVEVLRNDTFNETACEDRCLIFCQTEAEMIRMRELLEDSPLYKADRIFFILGSLTEGFDWTSEKTLLLGTGQLFGRLNRRKAVRKRLGKVIDSFLELAPGDLVIHVGHGLARFRGLKTIKKANQEEEHLELEFADNVVLYVPTSKFQLVQRYVGSGKTAPRLAKLNGSNWAKQKKAVQGAVLDLAAEMLELDAARKTLKGISYPPDSSWQGEFEESFPFVETNDQLAAIDEIKNDMERIQPMDRLLCGDVGFGKTEVAIRAAFKAVDAGYQVAVLVPTTILAEQHLRVFQERMAQFPISIAALTRFTSGQEKLKVLDGLKNGSIEIVIGTHSLTRSKIEFDRLGLVIIDEEQKFGVEDKDQLKKYRKLVDVLTMTATPIPRTLHFSLVGLRDISNLETPPENRLPVETKIVHFDDTLIRSLIIRELARDGQVYFLHNRVKDIENMAIKLRRIVPEARIQVGHAQMPDSDLEEVMRDFVLHKFDVLLSTTIIENGLDIPRANTIIIDNADKFGLAELHQLRGRVGRDKYQAYCYLLVEPGKLMTSDAVKRLKAIEEFSRLGSGFNIAMRDLEIRGAGNILGTEQSGHIATVGYEMYCDFLDAAVRMLKKQPQRVDIDVEVDLPGGTSIPKSYISDQKLKIDIYRRIQRITTMEQCAEFQEELRDRFGALPPEVERMLTVSKIRVLAFQRKISAVRLIEENGQKYIFFRFKAPEFVLALQKTLKNRWIDFRAVESQTGCIPLPEKFSKIELGASSPGQKTTPQKQKIENILSRESELSGNGKYSNGSGLSNTNSIAVKSKKSASKNSETTLEDELLLFIADLLTDPVERARQQFPNKNIAFNQSSSPVSNKSGNQIGSGSSSKTGDGSVRKTDRGTLAGLVKEPAENSDGKDQTDPADQSKKEPPLAALMHRRFHNNPD